jgi:hypothetical protein
VYRPLTQIRPENQRAHAVRRDAVLVCPMCGRRFRSKARQQLYCSGRCRQRGRRSKFAAADVFRVTGYQHSGHVTQPIKKANEFNDLKRRKSGPSNGICGPWRAIEAEVLAGRNWHPSTSLDGVVVQVAQMCAIRSNR